MKDRFKYLIAVLLFLLNSIFVLDSWASSKVVIFDFDNAPLYASLPISQTVSGLTARFYSTGQGFSIQNANVLGFVPQGFSGRCIYPNSINPADLLISFDQMISDFSIMYSCQELGCDDAATMRVTAFKNRTYVGTNTKTASNPGTWPVDTLKCSFPDGFDSVVVHYDKAPPTCKDYGVIFMADNMQVTTTNGTEVLEREINELIIPNPAYDELFINNNQVGEKIEIFNILGNKLIESMNTNIINISSLVPGVYFLKLSSKIIEFIKI